MICNREKRLRAIRPNAVWHFRQYAGRMQYVVFDGPIVLAAHRSKREAWARALSRVLREMKAAA